MRSAFLTMATLAACGHEATPAGQATVQTNAAAPVVTAAPTPPPDRLTMVEADYRGRWTGVEGMFLDVAAGDAPGRYRLTMQYDLDHKVTVDAVMDGALLAFTRDGRALSLRPTDGKATGLKYLAGKHDCLTVAPGEGYCRD